MLHENLRLNLLASLTEFPLEGFSEKVKEVQLFLDGCYPELGQVMDPFTEFVTSASLDELQELHTRTFEVQAITTLDIGYLLFGDDYKFTDKTLDYSASNQNHKGLLNRSFNSFYEFATEASMSRMYGGIHFRQACEAGLVQGKQIGKIVNGLEWKNSKTTAIK